MDGCSDGNNPFILQPTGHPPLRVRCPKSQKSFSGGSLGAPRYSWGTPRALMRCLTSIATLTPCLVLPPVQLGKFADFSGLPVFVFFLPQTPFTYIFRKPPISKKITVVEHWDPLFWFSRIILHQKHPLPTEKKLFYEFFNKIKKLIFLA